MAKFNRREILFTKQTGPSYWCSKFEKVPYIDSVAVYRKSENEIDLFLVNRCATKPQIFCCELQGFSTNSVIEHIQMFHKNKKATNLENHSCIRPIHDGNACILHGRLQAELQPLSWNVIRVRVDQSCCKHENFVRIPRIP